MDTDLQQTPVERPRKMLERPVPAEDIAAWREELGLSERAAAELLGMSRAGLRTCEREGAPLYIGLACQAVARGLSPYKAGDPIKASVKKIVLGETN